MADAMKLKAAVYRGTTDTGDGEGDPTGIVEINEMLKDKPHLITEAVKYLKARIKDRSPVTSCIAMDLLDQCMQSNGFQFQLYVVKKVLQRILKLALPNKGQHPHVQQKAAALIKFWANSYSADARLFEFSNAAKELARKEEMARGSTTAPGSAPARQADYSAVRRPDTVSHIPAAAPASAPPASHRRARIAAAALLARRPRAARPRRCARAEGHTRAARGHGCGERPPAPHPSAPPPPPPPSQGGETMAARERRRWRTAPLRRSRRAQCSRRACSHCRIQTTRCAVGKNPHPPPPRPTPTPTPTPIPPLRLPARSSS